MSDPVTTASDLISIIDLDTENDPVVRLIRKDANGVPQPNDFDPFELAEKIFGAFKPEDEKDPASLFKIIKAVRDAVGMPDLRASKCVDVMNGLSAFMPKIPSMVKLNSAVAEAQKQAEAKK